MLARYGAECFGLSWSPQEPVSLDAAPDYHAFVAPEQEMSLHIMEREARAGRYNSRAEFRADAAKIVAAAEAYNTSGSCRFPRELLSLDCQPFLQVSFRADAANILAAAEGFNTSGSCRFPHPLPTVRFRSGKPVGTSAS